MLASRVVDGNPVAAASAVALQNARAVRDTNTICFLIATFILIMKLAPRHTKEKIADAIDPAA